MEMDFVGAFELDYGMMVDTSRINMFSQRCGCQIMVKSTSKPFHVLTRKNFSFFSYIICCKLQNGPYGEDGIHFERQYIIVL